MQISTFCHFCHHKREFDVILVYNTELHVIVFIAFSNLKSTICKTHRPYTVHQNNIKFSFLMTKVKIVIVMFSRFVKIFVKIIIYDKLTTSIHLCVCVKHNIYYLPLGLFLIWSLHS